MAKEMDGIDELFQALTDKSNADMEVHTDSSDSKNEAEGDAEENLTTDELDDDKKGLRNFGFQEGEGQDTEVEGQDADLEGQEEQLEDIEHDEEVQNEDDESLIVEDDEKPMEVELQGESPLEHESENKEEDLRHLRFKDDLTMPFIHFNNRGIRHYKRQAGSFKGLDDHLIEYARIDLPAHKAAWDGNLQALEQIFLWKSKDGVPCIDRHGATPIHLAARRNQVNIIRWLMKYTDLSVMHQASRGETPVHVAAALGHADCVKALLASEERDVRYILSYLQDRLGFTCLLLAINKHQNAASKILIEELGLRSVSAINETGINSAHVAASAGNVDVLKMLHSNSRYKKLLHLRAADGTTPAYFAAQEGRLQALQFLSDTANCDMMKASEDGLKPIHAACQTGHTSIVKFIISRLGNGALKDPIVDGATPLHFAAAAGKVKTALWILKHDSSGELLNTPDHHGDTPLHDAVESGQLDAMQILIEQGADLYSANKFGKTPYSLAMESGSSEMQEFIEEFITRKTDEEEEALPNQMSIFDLEGGEEIANLEDNELEEEYPYDTTTGGPTPIPSRLFKDRLTVLARKPSLQLWPPMPCGDDSDDEEDPYEQQVLENIEEEEVESDETSGEQKLDEEEQEEDMQEEFEQEKEEKKDDKEERNQIDDIPPVQRKIEEGVVHRVVPVRITPAIEVVSVAPDEEEDSGEESDLEEQNYQEEGETVVNAAVLDTKGVQKEASGDKALEDKEVLNKEESEDSIVVATFPEVEVKLRKTNVAKKNTARKMSDPEFKGAGQELKNIFRFRKDRNTKY